MCSSDALLVCMFHRLLLIQPVSLGHKHSNLRPHTLLCSYHAEVGRRSSDPGPPTDSALPTELDILSTSKHISCIGSAFATSNLALSVTAGLGDG